MFPCSCCFDCKSTKNLRAIHNTTTPIISYCKLFRLQKYKKFESNSQHHHYNPCESECCFDCKSTKNLRAIHNSFSCLWPWLLVVSTAKVQKIWEQFTTVRKHLYYMSMLFRLQKYKKFESNSQHYIMATKLDYVVSTAKVQKIWEQFTTIEQPIQQPIGCFDCKSTKNLRAIHNTLLTNR